MRNCEICDRPVDHTEGFKGAVICDSCRGYYAHFLYRTTTIGDHVKRYDK